jgi:dTDP-glucose pyrophosphorylase
MIDLNTYCIPQTATIREALKWINGTSGSGQMLFVLNDKQQVVATLSDGDIRRGLISGHELNESVEQIMFRNFRYLHKGKVDIKQLRQFREQQLPIVPILDKDGRLCQIINLRKQKSMLPIDAVIMAGGKGERLRPLTLTTPKPLLLVGNKAIIDHNVDRLISYGVEHISVTVNYLAEQLEEHYTEPHEGVQVDCVREPKFLGTMGAVRLVKEFHNEVVLVMNSDLFTDIDFEDMYLHFIENNADMSIAAVPYTVSIPFGICDLDGRDVKGIVEKPTYNYYANAGIYMLRREVLDTIPENEFYNATDLIEALVQKKSKVIRYPLKGTWIDIGSMSEYQKAKDLNKHI